MYFGFGLFSDVHCDGGQPFWISWSGWGKINLFLFSGDAACPVGLFQHFVSIFVINQHLQYLPAHLACRSNDLLGILSGVFLTDLDKCYSDGGEPCDRPQSWEADYVGM